MTPKGQLLRETTVNPTSKPVKSFSINKGSSEVPKEIRADWGP